MAFYKAVSQAGELGNGRIKSPGKGQAYSSLSAVRRAIEHYKGPEELAVVPAVALAINDTGVAKEHGGARKKSGTQMPSGQKAVTVTTTMDPIDKANLIEFGGGKLAIGLRRAAELVRMSKKILGK